MRHQPSFLLFESLSVQEAVLGHGGRFCFVIVTDYSLVYQSPYHLNFLGLDFLRAFIHPADITRTPKSKPKITNMIPIIAVVVSATRDELTGESFDWVDMVGKAVILRFGIEVSLFCLVVIGELFNPTSAETAEPIITGEGVKLTDPNGPRDRASQTINMTTAKAIKGTHTRVFEDIFPRTLSFLNRISGGRGPSNLRVYTLQYLWFCVRQLASWNSSFTVSTGMA
jgi:hypothetical protein